jgi:alkylation response protein AidB-like acyl-CoA dehydrogenase
MLDDQPALLLVRGGADGLLWDETWRDALSLRASDSHDLHLREVYVPPENLIDCGAPAEKPPEAWFPLLVTCVYLGAALAARDAVIRYALERVPTALGKPIATLPKIQRQIGEIDVALQAAQTLLLAAARDWHGSADQRRALLPRLTAAKYLAAETAAAVTDKAMRIAGGASIGGGLPLARYFRDTRAGLMHPPAGDTALEIVGAGAVEAFRQAHHD